MGWILLALVFVAAVSFDHSEGCSCAGLNDLAFQYCNDEKELILRGVALNETLDDGETIQTWDDVSSYAFWITEVVKATGNASRLIEGKNVINIQAGMEGSMCGTSLTIGVEYVITAFLWEIKVEQLPVPATKIVLRTKLKRRPIAVQHQTKCRTHVWTIQVI
ncbi:hypothetical protein KP79_PYT11765 [Mizuhopecten yessoensis]|uniref:NTR domain-containing protein n=1 Tax=Mizuhopecten yessoensis TaxID=6573 RepID=A0A210PS76_MIZYE|nr:hypothetical protein KP79_PYT11765 [Mizuhopecten yessoensis]